MHDESSPPGKDLAGTKYLNNSRLKLKDTPN